MSLLACDRYMYGTMKNKITGEVANPEGRLAIVYARADDGSWKMILDMDNNYPD